MLSEGIYCIDALEGLKQIDDNSVDLILTDPPYKLSENSNVINEKEDEFQFRWLAEAKRILKPGGALLFFFAPIRMYGVLGYVIKNFTLKNLLVWHHPNIYSAGLYYGDDRFKLTWEVIIYAVKGERLRVNKKITVEAYRKYGNSFDVFIEPQPVPSVHRYQKPLNIVIKLVDLLTYEGDLVVDPFVGSGTTAVACKLLNRRFIGFEIVPEYCKLAIERVSNTFKPKDLRRWL